MGGKVLDLPEVVFYKMGIKEGEEARNKLKAEKMNYELGMMNFVRR